MRKHIQIDVKLYHCYEIRDVQGVSRIAHYLARYGFRPAIPSGRSDIRLLDDIDARVKGLFVVDQNWSPNKAIGRSLYALVGLPLLIDGLEELIASVCFTFWAPDYCVLGVGGLVDFEFKDQTTLVEPFAQRIRQLALQLWSECAPDYGCVDESFASQLDIRDALKLKLPSIGWANLFGPAYIEKYGNGFLSAIPGCTSQTLSDGSIFHQLTPTFIMDDRSQVKKLHQEVQDHFTTAGFKVTCKAPYRLGTRSDNRKMSRIGKTNGYGSDEDLKDYLQQAFSLTLTLDDGTRVKPIHVDWDILTSHQRTIALSFIKAVAISEITEHRDVPILFEFNELPDDLEQMMVNLVGASNPDFAYTRVDMTAG